MEQKTENLHSVIMEKREKLSVGGVTNVENFNEDEILLNTQMGTLTISGSELHINRLNVETGELKVEGNINSLIYDEGENAKEGFFAKLFR